jgi:hypothetical protein
MVIAHGKANLPNGADNRQIEFPDTERYRTLVVDLHTHSVFSDGHVWPRIRIGEAFRDGLDAIAITEHLEWQPHLADIPHDDRNRSYQQAVEAAGDSELLVIPGAEITRAEPYGHINAVFIEDANELVRFGTPDDPADALQNAIRAGEWPVQEAIDNANSQGAFVFWNHPWWSMSRSDGLPHIDAIHKRNISKDKLHGIEIANGDSYSEESFELALKYDLTILGVSDVHNLIDWDYKPHEGGHRPVNLVFAEEKTSKAIKEALFKGRTLVWYKNLLIGEKKNMMPLLRASITLQSVSFAPGGELVNAVIANHSDADFQLKNTTDNTFVRHADLVEVPAHGTLELLVKRPGKSNRLALDFEVVNALIAPKKHPSIELNAELPVPTDK